MNEEIRKIVNGYISEGDYEKALSILMNLPLEDDADKNMLVSCKKEFEASCTRAITDAVKAKDRQKAEGILLSYKKLIGEDANTTLFQTLVDSIQKENAAASKDRKPARQSINLSGIFSECTPDEKFIKSWRMWGVYAAIAIIMVFFACVGEATDTMCAASVAIAISLAIPVLACNNNRFKPIALIFLIIPIFASFYRFYNGITYSSSDSLLIPWLWSFLFIVVYNAIIPTKSWTIRAITSLLLFTALNPLWYGTMMSPGVESYVEGRSEYNSGFTHRRFTEEAAAFIIVALLITLIVYYTSLIGFRKLWNKIVRYKKQIGIGIGVIIGLVIIFLIVSGIKASHDRKVAEQQAIEQARQDSIQAAENARIAAIERARQDSIAAIKAREQARLDSIDYAEHAGFVSKYANVGLIISELRITNGTDDNGVASKGIKFTVFNPTHKTIKYVIAVCVAVNKFDDRVSDTQRCRGMGPIDSHDYGSWDFNNIFPDRNDVIDDISVYFQVIYTNGSTRTIRWKDAYVDSFKPSWFNGR